MEPNLNPDPVRAYADETIALLNHVEAVEDEIGELLGDTERTINGKLTDRHREIGTALKVADIYSNLAIAEAIDKLRETYVALPMRAAGVRIPHVRFADGDPHR